MKRCSRCGVLKDDSCFKVSKKYKDNLYCWCKDCEKNYAKVHYELHKDRHKQWYQNNKEQHRQTCKNYAQRCKERLYSFKQPCAKCGDERLCVIDFHHIDPSTKKFNVSTCAKDFSEDVIRTEVEKCVCLCRNCHTEFHYLYGNKPKHPIEDLTEYLGRNPYEI